MGMFVVDIFGSSTEHTQILPIILWIIHVFEDVKFHGFTMYLLGNDDRSLEGAKLPFFMLLHYNELILYSDKGRIISFP